MQLGLKDRVAIVTGSARGIGAETALALAEEGACIVVTDRDLAADTQTQRFERARDQRRIRIDGHAAHQLVAGHQQLDPHRVAPPVVANRRRCVDLSAHTLTA
ncbi:MAG TPA: SDR family NAD(P)-dependent oxidoreductase [Pseudomonadales bacterium]|nr:SDR family NAD(P)-dependent oxidoreductase [Pseudomonadales bacterium]